jgi:hypothetical protein
VKTDFMLNGVSMTVEELLEYGEHLVSVALYYMDEDAQ